MLKIVKFRSLLVGSIRLIAHSPLIENYLTSPSKSMNLSSGYYLSIV